MNKALLGACPSLLTLRLLDTAGAGIVEYKSNCMDNTQYDYDTVK